MIRSADIEKLREELKGTIADITTYNQGCDRLKKELKHYDKSNLGLLKSSTEFLDYDHKQQDYTMDLEGIGDESQLINHGGNYF